MAKVDMNSITKHLKGKVGDVIFRKHRGVMQAVLRPTTLFRKPPSDDQLAQRNAFKEALIYAKSATADPEKRAVYERVAAVKNMTAFALAVGDVFHPPTVRKIDMTGYAGRLGDKITVLADDDVAVRSVSVLIRKTADGSVLEEGQADNVFDAWVYTAKAAVPAGEYVMIEVTATDWAGKQGKGHQPYPT